MYASSFSPPEAQTSKKGSVMSCTYIQGTQKCVDPSVCNFTALSWMFAEMGHRSRINAVRISRADFGMFAVEVRGNWSSKQLGT